MVDKIAIPKPLKLRDADVFGDNWFAIAEHMGTDYLVTEFLQAPLLRRYRCPRIRLLNDEHLVLLDCVAHSNNDENGSIIDREAKQWLLFMPAKVSQMLSRPSEHLWSDTTIME